MSKVCSWPQPRDAALRMDLPWAEPLAPGHSGGSCPNTVGCISCSPVNHWGDRGSSKPIPTASLLSQAPAGCKMQIPPLADSWGAQFCRVPWMLMEPPTEGQREGLPWAGGRCCSFRALGRWCQVMPESCSLLQPGLHIQLLGLWGQPRLGVQFQPAPR